MVFGPPGIFFRKRLHELNPTLPLQSLQSLEKKKERLGSETSARIVWCLRHLYVGFLECEKWKEP